MDHFEELQSLDPNNATYTGPAIEMPTPHKVAVLMLVQQYFKAKKTSGEAGLAFTSQSRRHFCMLLLKLIQYPDMTYNDLHNLLNSQRYRIDSLHMESFEKAMSDLFSLGIEILFDFSELQNIEKMLSEQIGVSQFSIVGLYIRRVGVILERLTFPEMMALYKNICLYYEKGVRTLAIAPRRSGRRNSSISCSSNSTTNSSTDYSDETIEESVLDTETVHQDRNPHSKWSLKQADLFVTQQCSLLENNELRALPPIELQTKLDEIINDNPLDSKTYFLCYLNQLRLRDYFGARDALHRSFDRSPMQMLAQYEKGFQYFSVNLGIMHACFNHRREALDALKECVMLAQEAGDKRCLDLANSWYCMLKSNKIDPFEKSLPDIQDPALIQSLSLAIQFVVKFGAQCGYLPLDLFELLLKSDELNFKNSILEHVSDSLSLRSALWCMYGRHEVSAMYAQLLLNLKKTWSFGDIGNSESVSKVLSSLALWLNVQGEQQKSAVVLHHARERFPRYPNASNWMISQCHITIQQAIYRCHWQEAMKSCCQLFLLDENLANLQRATIYVAKRYFNSAREVLNSLLNSGNLEILVQVRVLVLLSHLSMAENSLSSETVDLLVRASVLAASAYLEYEHAMVDMVLAQVLLKMGMPQKAFQAITNCMDRIYINGGVYDCAKTDFTFARCLVGASENAAQRKSRLENALNMLERAAESFKTLEAHSKVLDVYVYVAKTYNELGDETARNKYAGKFKQYHTEHPTAREYLDMTL